MMNFELCIFRSFNVIFDSNFSGDTNDRFEVCWIDRQGWIPQRDHQYCTRVWFSCGTKNLWPSWYKKGWLYWINPNWCWNHEEVCDVRGFFILICHAPLQIFQSFPSIEIYLRRINIFMFNYHFKSAAESNVKRVSLELGGKSPLIIFNDCDMEKAVRQVNINAITGS